jgi:hypothetical protein
MKVVLFRFGAIAFGQTPAQISSYVLGPDDHVVHPGSRFR